MSTQLNLICHIFCISDHHQPEPLADRDPDHDVGDHGEIDGEEVNVEEHEADRAADLGKKTNFICLLSSP